MRNLFEWLDSNVTVALTLKPNAHMKKKTSTGMYDMIITKQMQSPITEKTACGSRKTQVNLGNITFQ